MSHRTVSWTRIDRVGQDARTKIPTGMLGARALVQLGARTRPLVVAGRYDRAAIMAAACKVGGALADIDALKIWRSVDENEAVAPRYRDPETIEIIREIQAEQRHTSMVEDWIIEGTDVPFDRWMTATELFREHFREFVEETRPNEVRSWDNRKLGLELTRLTRSRRAAEEAYTIERKMMAGKAQYRLSRSNVVEFCSPASRRFGELMAGMRAAAE